MRALNKLFPDRPFTPDGHLVGSIGEVIAADTYDLTLEKCSNAGFDAKTQTLRTVEIKLTGGDSVSVSSDCNPPEFLIVFEVECEDWIHRDLQRRISSRAVEAKERQ